ncbi:MAG: SufE family protein [Anaerolineae bacterium]
MSDTSNLPPKLAEIIEDFSWVNDRRERSEMLIYYADQFESVPEEVATRPFPEEHHVNYCESDAYVWGTQQEDGTMQYYFAVENPQGLSAMAMSAILAQTINGLPPEQIVEIDTDIVLDIFGKDVSMGKGQGLMGIVGMVGDYARQNLKRESE